MLKRNRIFIVFVAILTISLASSALATPDQDQLSAVKAAQPQTTVEPNTFVAQKQIIPTAQVVTEKEMEQAKAELARDYYKECLDAMKWAIGLIIGLLIVFVGYVGFKNTREYQHALADVKDALNQAREASKEARTASEKTRDWEVKAQERLSSIDTLVNTKLKEIEAKGGETITKLIQEAKKQQEESKKQAEQQLEINKLWSDALKLRNEDKYEEACDKWAQIINLKPDHWAYNNWGNVLTDFAKTKEDNKLLEQACQKYAEAIKIKPDLHEAFYNWGIALLEFGMLKGNEAFFEQACQKYAEVIKIKPEMHEAYNNWGVALANLLKLKGDEKLFEQACQKYAEAIKIKPDKYEAYNNWGHALIILAVRKQGKIRQQLLQEAQKKCLKAESIKNGSGAYNLACVYALLGDKEECKKWLKVGEQAGTLVTRKHAMADRDLESVCNEEWFKQIRWRDDPK